MAKGAAARKSSSQSAEKKLRELFCDIGRRIWQRGFCAGNEGNHSYRLGPNRVLCTPTGISKGQLKPGDMCIVDMDCRQVAGKRRHTSEIRLHLAIYKLRPDVKAVVHSHPPHATAFAISGLDLPTCVHPEAEVFLGPVHTAKYVTPGDNRLGESVAPFVKDSCTILMGSHGVVCFGRDLEDAYYKLEIVDAYARILILAKQLGSIRTLTDEQMRELVLLKSQFAMTDPRLGADGKTVTLSRASEFLARFGDNHHTGV